jgi:integrase
LRELQRKTKGGFVFETKRGGPFTPNALNRHIKRLGERAGFDYPIHAHMLRHACGYALANAGHWLGHRSILIAAQRMRGRLAVLNPAHMQRGRSG